MTDQPNRSQIVLHVGLAKAGTTAIQMAAHERRAELFDRGVLYPGKEFNHRSASRAVGNHRTGWRQDGKAPSAPDIRHWDELVAEVHEQPERTAFISHEYFADYSPDVCERIVADLGTTPTVVFTMRNQISATSSMWQQFVKYGKTETFDEWLTRQLGTLESEGNVGGKFLSRLHCSDLVRKWADVVGERNIVLIALDKTQPNLLFDSFESLLQLPNGFLADVELDRRAANRSFSLEEAEMIRAVNEHLRDHPDMTWPRYQRLVRYGAIDPLLAAPNAASETRTINVPQWAAERIHSITKTEIERLSAMNVRVLGELGDLAALPRNVGDNPVVDGIDLETATKFTDSVLKAGLAAVRQRRDHIEKLQGPVKVGHHRVKDIALSEFARAAFRKAGRRLSFKKSKKRNRTATEQSH